MKKRVLINDDALRFLPSRDIRRARLAIDQAEFANTLPFTHHCKNHLDAVFSGGMHF